jgi:DNA-binding NtrC family response regulator
MVRKIPVLLVEDMSICEQVKMLLADSRFEIHSYNTVEESRQALNASRFEIAVADLRTTAADGSSFISAIIEALPKIRCIAVVERPDIASVQQAMKLGCKSYLAKPVSPEAIVKAINDVAQTCGLLTMSERELQLRLSRLLRAQRLRQELTLTEMANRIGLSKAQLSQIELGKSWPSFPTLKRISDELDQPFSELFKAVEQQA